MTAGRSKYASAPGNAATPNRDRAAIIGLAERDAYTTDGELPYGGMLRGIKLAYIADLRRAQGWMQRGKSWKRKAPRCQ